MHMTLSETFMKLLRFKIDVNLKNTQSKLFLNLHTSCYWTSHCNDPKTPPLYRKTGSFTPFFFWMSPNFDGLWLSGEPTYVKVNIPYFGVQFLIFVVMTFHVCNSYLSNLTPYDKGTTKTVCFDMSPNSLNILYRLWAVWFLVRRSLKVKTVKNPFATNVIEIISHMKAFGLVDCYTICSYELYKVCDCILTI